MFLIKTKHSIQQFPSLQICLTTTHTLSDAVIQEIRSDLEGLPGLHTKAIENILVSLKRFVDNPVNASFLTSNF